MFYKAAIDKFRTEVHKQHVRVIAHEGELVIIQTCQEDPFFFLDMGPYLVSRSVRRELEIAISSTPDYLWYLVYDEQKVIAFAALEVAEPIIFRHAYVSPDYREQGLYQKLLDVRLVEAVQFNAQVVRVIAAPATAKMFERAGFELVTERGKFKTYEKRLR